MTNTDPADVKNRHFHGLTATDAQVASLDARIKALSAAIEAHDARLDALEDDVEPPPVDPPDPPPSGEPAFLSRPASGPIVIDGGGKAVSVSNKTVKGGPVNAPSGQALKIENAVDVTILDFDWDSVIGGIYLFQCSGVLRIENCRGRNVGDGTIGSGHSNHIQLAECSFTGAIRNNRFLGGRTEDMLSIWHSGGKGVGQELLIEGNHLEGRRTDSATVRAWTRTSGTGIILSDGAGSSKNGNLIVRNNTLLTPGQVCIQIIDGPNLQILNNTILAEPYALNNNPMTTWEGTPRGVASGNRWYMTKGDGSHPNPWLQGGTNPQITGTIGTADPNLKASDLAVILLSRANAVFVVEVCAILGCLLIIGALISTPKLSAHSSGDPVPGPVVTTFSPFVIRDDSTGPGPAVVSAPAILRGQATWYTSAGSGEAAAGPKLRKFIGSGWRGSAVDVCQQGKTWLNCTRVRLTDWCACSGDRIIDLSDEDFSKFAPLSKGVIRVQVALGAPPRETITQPPTDTE